MNKAILHGRLTRDPEVRYTRDSKAVVDFSLAVNRQHDREKTDFFNCEAWGTLAEIVGKYLVKGSEIVVSGELHVSSYEDKEGIKRTSTTLRVEELDFCGKKGE